VEDEDCRRGQRIEVLESGFASVSSIVTGESGQEGECDVSKIVEVVSNSVKALRTHVAELQDESRQQGERISTLESSLRSIRSVFVEDSSDTLDSSSIAETVSNSVHSLRSHISEVEKEDQQRGERIKVLESGA
jgi:chromosome segregation ATPase